jgi:hypothetical protein
MLVQLLPPEVSDKQIHLAFARYYRFGPAECGLASRDRCGVLKPKSSRHVKCLLSITDSITTSIALNRRVKVLSGASRNLSPVRSVARVQPQIFRLLSENFIFA